jgi:hypothetical protein
MPWRQLHTSVNRANDDSAVGLLYVHSFRPGVEEHRCEPRCVTLVGVGLLLVWDIFPGSFRAGAHDFLAAFPLAMIAVAYLVYRVTCHPAPVELVKAVMLAMAFFFGLPINSGQALIELHFSTILRLPSSDSMSS